MQVPEPAYCRKQMTWRKKANTETADCRKPLTTGITWQLEAAAELAVRTKGLFYHNLFPNDTPTLGVLFPQMSHSRFLHQFSEKIFFSHLNPLRLRAWTFLIYCISKQPKMSYTDDGVFQINLNFNSIWITSFYTLRWANGCWLKFCNLKFVCVQRSQMEVKLYGRAWSVPELHWAVPSW
jgi:hypothetical protein